MRHGRLPVVLLCAAVLGSCVPYELRTILDGPKGKALSLGPDTIVLPANGSVTFTADGGVPPYVYSLVSGGGALDPSTGVYVAPLVPGSAEIKVTDATGKSAKSAVTIVVFLGSLAISPGALSLQVGSNVTFIAIGGSPPYTFAMQSSGSGSPSVNATSGSYVAGTTPGTDVIRVTDAAAATTTATVTVTNLTSSVDYTIPSFNFPPTGTSASAIPGGYTFTLRNSGSAPGTQTVSWKLFLSANSAIDGGDMMVGSGTASPVGAGLSTTVSIAGAFPPVAPGAWNLIAQVDAPDDTTPANNTSGAGAITLSAMNIDYTVNSVSSTGATIAGAGMSGSVSLSNVGSAGDTGTVEWAVYASLDTVLDGADYLLSRGTISGLGAGAGSGPISFLGYWPSSAATWYLVAEVSSAVDVGGGNNTATGGPVVVSGPPPADVDYIVLSVGNAGGTTAGDPLSGSFTARNTGSAGGAQPVSWVAYLSSDATLQVGTDPVIDSGSLPALGAGASSSPIAFAGTWPSAPASWRLIVAVSSSDDTAPGNNVTASGSVATTAPNVDYTPQFVQSTGGTTAGSPLAGSFVIHNAGTHAGTQFIPWAVYLSSDSTLNVGSDTLLATGSVAAPGLAAGADSSSVPFAGTWPGATVSKTWYLIASVGAGDDVNPVNNAGASGGILVNPPDINYTVPAVPGVTNTGGTTAGGAMSGSFTISNIGTAAGASTVAWTAYISSNATLEVTDQVVATGSIGPLGGGGSSGSIPFSGTWPAGTGSWYLTVNVSVSDDINSTDDVRASASAIVVTSTTPAYVITSVPAPTGTITQQAVSGTFTIQNQGFSAGTSLVQWQVFASYGDSVYGAGDIALASGSFAGLASSASTSPSWSGTWPDTPGTYYLIVRASAQDSTPILDAASAPITVTSPPPPDYTATFSPTFPWSGLGGTLMTLTGTCQITIQNVTANTGRENITWSVYLSGNNVLDAGDTLLQTGSVGPLSGSGSTTVGFSGTWPAGSAKWYFIAQISALDDANGTNDVVPAPHLSVTGDYRYKEGAEDNSGIGPNPPALQTSTASTLALGSNQTLVIEGTMDAFGNYDTYSFPTGASMSKLSIYSAWQTGFDDVDLYLWDTGATNLSSVTTGIDSEPGSSTWTITGVTPRTCYIGAYAWLANNTSGSAGKTYLIVVTGKP